MLETMAEYHGVGLAAPQVHESLRIFVAALDDRDDDEEGPEAEPIALSIRKSRSSEATWSKTGKAA